MITHAIIVIKKMRRDARLGCSLAIARRQDYPVSARDWELDVLITKAPAFNVSARTQCIVNRRFEKANVPQVGNVRMEVTAKISAGIVFIAPKWSRLFGAPRGTV